MKSVTRAKFRCQSVVQLGETSEQVTFSAVLGGTEENESFAKATPNGSLQITVDNDAVKGKFAEGKEYYLDITEADSAA
jgi:hypothetical protein